MTATGWTPEATRRLGLRDLNDLFAHWTETPPVHESLAAIVAGFGGGTKVKRGPSANSMGAAPSDPRALLADARSCGIPGAKAGKVPAAIRKILHPNA